MFKRLALATILGTTLWGGASALEEQPISVKGVFHGKVQQTTFEQPFEMRIEPGEQGQLRVEMEGTDLQLGVQPRWRYNADNTPNGMYMNLVVKCQRDTLKYQRHASLLVNPAQKSTVELNDKDQVENLFTVELEAQGAGGEAQQQ